MDYAHPTNNFVQVYSRPDTPPLLRALYELVPLCPRVPSKGTANLTLECYNDIFHFRLWTWAAAALARAIGEQAKPKVSIPEHGLSTR